MDIQFKSFTDEDTAQAIAIWNQIVTDGVAFPQTETLTLETGKAFFKAQTNLHRRCLPSGYWTNCRSVYSSPK